MEWFSASTARSISGGEESFEKSRPAPVNSDSNSFQSAFFHCRLGVGCGGCRSKRICVERWSEVNESPKAQPRIASVPSPLENVRSIMVGRCPFLGKCVGVPGLELRV